MDIINYTEVDKLEEHLKNRTIQEALLREDTIEWAFNYDKENLGKNFAIAYGLNVSDWEQYKSFEDFEKIDSSISGSSNPFVILGRIDLRFADLFYDKILPNAKVYEGVWRTGTYTQHIQNGISTVLKVEFRSHDGHDRYTLNTRIQGDYVDTNLTTITAKLVNKYNDLSVTWSHNGNNCANGYTFKVWYI